MKTRDTIRLTVFIIQKHSTFRSVLVSRLESVMNCAGDGHLLWQHRSEHLLVLEEYVETPYCSEGAEQARRHHARGVSRLGRRSVPRLVVGVVLGVERLLEVPLQLGVVVRVEWVAALDRNVRQVRVVSVSHSCSHFKETLAFRAFAVLH